MEKYSKYLQYWAGLAFFACFSVNAQDIELSNTNTTFTATVIDASCSWTWDSSILNFPPISANDVISGKTLVIKPLTASIDCNLPLTPQLLVSGNTPFPETAMVFLDGSNTRNIGFMLQADDGSQTMPGLANFYSNGLNGKALVNNVPFSLTKINGQQQTKQIIWVGLVGMNNSNTTVPGKFSASLTLTGLIP